MTLIRVYIEFLNVMYYEFLAVLSSRLWLVYFN
jgi:hypothetical protein